MSEFIDLIYCSDLDGEQILACAPTSAYIRKGDIVRIDGKKDFYFVSCQTSVMKSSDVYKLITEIVGNLNSSLHKVTDKYSHVEIGGNENE